MDSDVARELELFADNDYELYQMKEDTYFKNLAVKKAQGKYDSSKAPKLLRYFVDKIVDKYKREQVMGPFPVDRETKDYIAKEYVKEFEGRFKAGDFRQFFPKKYQKKASKKAAKKRSVKSAAKSKIRRILNGK